MIFYPAHKIYISRLFFLVTLPGTLYEDLGWGVSVASVIENVTRSVLRTVCIYAVWFVTHLCKINYDNRAKSNYMILIWFEKFVLKLQVDQFCAFFPTIISKCQGVRKEHCEENGMGALDSLHFSPFGQNSIPLNADLCPLKLSLWWLFLKGVW